MFDGGRWRLVPVAEGHPRDIQDTPESMTVEGLLYFNHRQAPALLITLQ